MDTYQQLKQLAGESGCAGFGVTTADPFANVANTIAARRDAGLSGKLQFTYKQPGIATDVRQSFPWARSLVVLSWSYLPEGGTPGLPLAGTGRIARFATSDHYHGLRDALAKIEHALTEAGWQTAILLDDDRLIDRAAAVRAGVAWWGKSSMVLDPRHGPWLLLGSVATDAVLPVDAPMSRDCGTCVACIPACPTGAIVAPGVLDASRCLAYWLQMPGDIPIELRKPMGDRVYGCDDCLEACPPGTKRLVEAESGVGRVDLFALLAADDSTLLESYDHFYIPRRRPRFLRRNALIALANSTADAIVTGQIERAEVVETVGVLAGYMGDPDDVYRVHAAWAIGRVNGPGAAPLLRHRLRLERSQHVIAEIELALAGLETAEP